MFKALGKLESLNIYCLLTEILIYLEGVLPVNFLNEALKVAFGSLVVTDNGTYLISIGIGKIQIDDQICYAIFFASPIGGLLKDKVVGDEVQFQGRTLKIKEVV